MSILLLTRTVAWALKPESTRLGDGAMKTESSELFIGVDISKARLDIANDSNSEVWSELNNDSGVSLLVEKLTSLKPCLVVMEATGGIETLLYSSLVTAGFPAVVINPRQVRDFAKALGKYTQVSITQKTIRPVAIIFLLYRNFLKKKK